eukprot:GHVU01123071.1.p1 GENE.GHVU01123071.1~~GHVU01123071.1.p1  ORF type:complete len:535 (-),score=110.45 GHVU01123071.1:115-1719(-)
MITCVCVCVCVCVCAGEDGFCLARCGSGSPSDQSASAAALGASSLGGASPAPHAAVDAHDSISSLLHYTPFTPWAAHSASHWTVALPEGEHVLCVAAGAQFVAAATSKRVLRVFFSSGVTHSAADVSGAPVCLSARGDLLLCLSQTAAAPGGDRVYQCEVFDVPRTRRLQSAAFSLPSAARVSWAGLTPMGSPVLHTSNGDVYSLLPVWEGRLHSWVYLMSLPQSSSASKTLKYHPVAAEEMELRVVRTREGDHLPLSGGRIAALRYRVPQPLPEGAPLLSYDAWHKADPEETLRRQSENDQEGGASSLAAALSWRVFDETRYRQQLLLRQRAFKQSLGPGVTVASMRSQADHAAHEAESMEARKAVEKYLTRIFVMSLADGQVEAAFDAAKLFQLSTSIRTALRAATSKAERGLVSRLQSLLEWREMSERHGGGWSGQGNFMMTGGLNDPSSSYPSSPYSNSSSGGGGGGGGAVAPPTDSSNHATMPTMDSSSANGNGKQGKGVVSSSSLLGELAALGRKKQQAALPGKSRGA